MSSSLRIIPKIEFHRHLDGSVRLETIVDLAKQYDLNLGFDLNDKSMLLKKTKITKPMQSLQEVLDTFWTTQKVMATKEALARIAYENVEDVFNDGVVLSELRFAPSFIRVGKPHLSYDDIIEGILLGIDKGCAKFPVQVGLIHIIPRSLDCHENGLATEAIFRFKNQHALGKKYLVGIDLADAEVTTRPEDFVAWIDLARKNNLHVTIHSAEDSSAKHAKVAIDLYRPERIGHGIKIAQDKDVLSLVKKSGIHLENCLTSNWLTKSVLSHDEHPFKYFLDEGVSVSLNSDDPHLMDIDLTHEYELAQNLWGLTPQDFFKINSQNIAASFLTNDQKEKIKKEYFLRD